MVASQRFATPCSSPRCTVGSRLGDGEVVVIVVIAVGYSADRRRFRT